MTRTRACKDYPIIVGDGVGVLVGPEPILFTQLRMPVSESITERPGTIKPVVVGTDQLIEKNVVFNNSTTSEGKSH